MNIYEQIVGMTEREKEAHIDGVEFTLDYGLMVTDEDKQIYDELIKERSEKNNGRQL